MDSELVKRLGSLIKPCSQATLKKKKEAFAASITSKFGGIPYFEEPDLWPICTDCALPLTFICQINTAECKHGSSDPALYTFFYCWDCSPWGLTNEKPGMWKVSRYGTPAAEKIVERVPTIEPKYPTVAYHIEFSLRSSLPDWDEVNSIDPSIAARCAVINAEEPWQPLEDASRQLHSLDNYATIIGGYPRWIQGEIAEVLCPLCSASMNFFAQIDSEEKAALMWGDSGCVYLFQCPIHPAEFHLELQCY